MTIVVEKYLPECISDCREIHCNECVFWSVELCQDIVMQYTRGKL